MILAFDNDYKAFIDTQFPSNLDEFLGLSPDTLIYLEKQHMQHKMEPNYHELIIENKLNVASFYTGFSFRHYVGKPNYAITIFLSDDDKISEEFEGMIRRIAHELLPKRDALNFDDIFGKYYEMLKNGELSPYWEEIVEGETNNTLVKEREEKKIEKEMQNDESTEASSIDVDDEELLKQFEEIKEKNQELEEFLEEKAKKIRELTNKYTELMEEKNSITAEVESLKTEVSEQYIKLEKWSQQMADLNEKNVKLLEDIKKLNEKSDLKDNEIEVKDKKIRELNQQLDSAKKAEKGTDKLMQEIENLKSINLNLNTEIEKFMNEIKELQEENDKTKYENTIHIDSITNLKLELKNLKDELTSEKKETDKIKGETFDFKKEIKVLRRERDHYQKIVKENNLL